MSGQGDKDKDVMGPGFPQFFICFFFLVSGFCHYPFLHFRRVHAASKMRRLRICNSQPFHLSHFDSATAFIHTYFLNRNLLLNSLGQQMPLAGKSNQIKQRSRNEKLIKWKCSKKSTLNIWLTKKARIQTPVSLSLDFFFLFIFFSHSKTQTMRSLAFHLNLQLYSVFERAMVGRLWSEEYLSIWGPRPQSNRSAENKEMEIIIVGSHQPSGLSAPGKPIKCKYETNTNRIKILGAVCSVLGEKFSGKIQTETDRNWNGKKY